MCEDGIKLETGAVVACRKCNQCQQAKILGWVGRCCAEAQHATGVSSLTLTYDDATAGQSRGVFLFYSDVQRLFKRLRRAGYPLRYVVAGEYGEQKARAHWHCLIFWQGKIPDLPPMDEEKQHWSFWNTGGRSPKPMGFVYHQRPDGAGMHYVVKYLQKQQGQRVAEFRQSRKPAIGSRYLIERAEKIARDGMEFHDFTYAVPGDRTRNGAPFRRYLESVALRRAVVEAYVRESRRQGREPAHTEPVLWLKASYRTEATAETPNERILHGAVYSTVDSTPHSVRMGNSTVSIYSARHVELRLKMKGNRTWRGVAGSVGEALEFLASERVPVHRDRVEQQKILERQDNEIGATLRELLLLHSARRSNSGALPIVCNRWVPYLEKIATLNHQPELVASFEPETSASAKKLRTKATQCGNHPPF